VPLELEFTTFILDTVNIFYIIISNKIKTNTMKAINVYRTVTFLSVAIIIILFIYAPQPIAWFIGFFLFIFFFTGIDLSKKQAKEDNSFKNPFSLSQNEAGLMLKIDHIKDNRLALMRWGYSSNKRCIGVFEEFYKYYKPESVPQELRNAGTIFEVTMNDNGLVCKKIKFHGFAKNPEQPFEVIEKSYHVAYN
jgi:hypothetical protein